MNTGNPAVASGAGRPPAVCDCAGRSILHGAWGFALVSLGGFSVWAFAGRWFYRNVGELGLYAATAMVFMVLAGVFMHPLVRGPSSIARFYKVFVPAFLAYSIVWCAAWFALRFGAGEWLGSFAGSLAFAAVSGWGFGNRRAVLPAGLVLFVTHSLGYFVGDKVMHHLVAPGYEGLFSGLGKEFLGVTARLSWGLFYGLGFGAGMGFAYYLLQKRPDPASANSPPAP